MYEAWIAPVAILSLLPLAYALRMRGNALRAQCRLQAAERREYVVLEATRSLVAASGESPEAVYRALDASLRTADPAIDSVLLFVQEALHLRCVYASGMRVEYFRGMRIGAQRGDTLAALAFQRGGRALLPEAPANIPTDRFAIAVPLHDGQRSVGVAYAASARLPFQAPDSVARVMCEAAIPLALAAERNADRERATYDGLTGLHTPRALRERLHEEVLTARSTGSTLALWFIDTDDFKRVNDTLGHAAGDRVLREMAALLRAHTAPSLDTSARNGGDEFCAIVRNVFKSAAIDRACNLCAAVRDHDFGTGFPITASVGVAAFPQDAAGAAELLEAADAAMYHSKREGRDRVTFLSAQGGFQTLS